MYHQTQSVTAPKSFQVVSKIANNNKIKKIDIDLDRLYSDRSYQPRRQSVLEKAQGDLAVQSRINIWFQDL
jgi:hypothetical protein